MSHAISEEIFSSEVYMKYLLMLVKYKKKVDFLIWIETALVITRGYYPSIVAYLSCFLYSTFFRSVTLHEK
jgi:hypothetical protein